ncbi:SNR7/TML1 protein [Gonium pectorale]|uniref:SNR7/TML1 protein n=1 Tax=Gonium pectorale TaxID=33097 RepID=A0A150G2I2_GONPE|nr:SNR7/TML1 protein [Gonium pectorale]|eukprot:KXZ44048.1 SNR7/TML1 protein [Gonium pectorale]
MSPSNTLRPEDLCGEGEVRQLAVQSFGPVHRALVLFTAGVVSVWDLRATQLICSINPNDGDTTLDVPALAAAGEATAVCWIGTSRGDFATGHVDGSVLVWALPGLDPGQAALAATMRVVRDSAAPVRAIRCVFGEEGDSLLVLGGQEAEQPDALTLLPLPSGPDEADEDEDQSDEEDSEDSEAEGNARARARQGARARARAAARKPKQGPTRLPWFGHIIGFCLVAEGGNVSGYEAPAAVLQLVEGGQLVLQELRSQQPIMLTPRFQQRTHVTVTEAPMVPIHRPSGSSPSAISLAALRKVADEAASEEERLDPSGLGAFSCGTPPAPPSDASWGLVYCTGYKDGGVALWDLHGGTTRLLCAAPAGDAADGSRLADSSCGAVTCLSLAWPTGLLIAGHAKGEVRMYQFSSVERQADCVTLESINTPGAVTPLRQPPGLQLRLRVKVNSGEITSLGYCQAIRAVAAGDKAGGVALIDTAKPLVRWYAMPGQQPVLAAAVAPLPLPPARLRVPEVLGEEGAPSHAVIVADAEGCVVHGRRRRAVGSDDEEAGNSRDSSARAGSGRPASGSGQRGGSGRSGRHAGDDDEDDEGAWHDEEDGDDMDVEAMLAKAAAQATDQYLRLYTAANVLAGDRGTAAKRSPLPGQSWLYARPVQVYSLPSLEVVLDSPLSTWLSWYWDLPSGSSAGMKLGRLAATSRLGELLILGLSNELLRLSLAAGLPPTAQPQGLFDPAAATASLTAAAEYEAERLLPAGRLGRAADMLLEQEPQRADPSSTSDMIEGVDSPRARTEGRRVEKLGPAAAAAAAANVATTAASAAANAAEKAAGKMAGAAKEGVTLTGVTLTRVFNRVQQGLTRAVEETTRGVKQLATNVATNVATVQAALTEGGAGAAGSRPPAAGGPRSAEWYASLPDLGAVFSRTVPDDGTAASRQRQGRLREEEEDEDDDDVSELSITAGGAGEESLRNELFGGARPYTSSGGGTAPPSRPSAGGGGGVTAPRARTAEEIKRAYGRAPADRAGAANARTNELRSVMEENRSKLEERGQKLRQLDDKAADLEASAAGFAEMARQLAERERNKKWWQL